MFSLGGEKGGVWMSVVIGVGVYLVILVERAEGIIR